MLSNNSPFIKITHFSLTFIGTTGGSTPCTCADDFRHCVTQLEILVETQFKPYLELKLSQLAFVLPLLYVSLSFGLALHNMQGGRAITFPYALYFSARSMSLVLRRLEGDSNTRRVTQAQGMKLSLRQRCPRSRNLLGTSSSPKPNFPSPRLQTKPNRCLKCIRRLAPRPSVESPLHCPTELAHSIYSHLAC